MVMVYIAGDAKYIAKSIDGETWTILPKPNTSGYGHIIYANGKFIVFGIRGVASSTDGETWQEFDNPHLSSANWSSMAYGDGKFVMVCFNGSQFTTSTDGEIWSERKKIGTLNYGWHGIT